MSPARYVRLERGIHFDTISGSYRASTTSAAGASVYGFAKDLHTARAWLSNARAAREAGVAPPPSPMKGARTTQPARPTAKSLRSFWLDWYDQKIKTAEIGLHQARGRRREVLRPGTLDGYALLMRCHLLPALGDCTLEPPRDGGITKSAVAEMRDGLARKGLADRTQNEILVLLRRLLEEAAEEGYSVVNVARSVNPVVPANPLKRKQTKTRPLSSEERLLLTSALPVPVQAAGYLSSWAAMRSGEVLGIQVGDLDLWTEIHDHVGWVSLQRQRRHDSLHNGDTVVPWLKHRSEGDGRILPLAPSLVEYLRWYVTEILPAGRHPDDFLVRASGRGNRTQDQSSPRHIGAQSWTYAMKQAVGSTPTLRYETLGFDVTAHNLREDCLSEIKDLVSPYARSSYAGHLSIEHGRGTGGAGTTDNSTTYSKHYESDLVAVALAAETLIQRATGGLGLIPKPDERRTAAEVAADLGVSVSLINKLAKGGTLPFELVRNGPKSSRRLFPLAADDLVRDHIETTTELSGASDWSVKEAARLLGLHHQTLRREIIAGRVPSAFKVSANYPSGFVWRLPSEAVAELVALRLRGASAPTAQELLPRADAA